MSTSPDRRDSRSACLSLLPERPAGDLLVTNADIITRLQYARLFAFHRAHGGWATMTAVEHVTQIPYGVLRTRGEGLAQSAPTVGEPATGGNTDYYISSGFGGRQAS